MGRPPSAWSSCQSPTRPWGASSSTASGGYGAFSGSGSGSGPLRGSSQSNGRRHFVVPIPAVPTRTAAAIRQSVAGGVSLTQPHLAAQQNRIRMLSAKLREQREKATTCLQKIAALETEKEQSLRDIRETRQQEAAHTMASLERKLKNRYNKELTAARIAWQEQLDKDCEAKRQAWRLARDCEQANAEAEKRKQPDVVNDITAEEPAKKRMKLTDSAATASSLGDDASKEEGELMDVAATPTDTPDVDASIHLAEQPATDIKKSDTLKQELAKAEATLEKLNETRTEMIWLLKQVIKAEEKQKVDLRKAASAAATATATIATTAGRP